MNCKRVYRAVSYASTTVLAASSSLEFQALALKRKYKRLKALDSRDEAAEYATRNVRDVPEEEVWGWLGFQLCKEDSEHRIVEAVFPRWEA
jgi:hypothetical protein